MGGKPKIHGNPMSADDVIEAKKHLGIQNVEPFLFQMNIMNQPIS